MSGIKYSNLSFTLYHVFSRMLLPFGAVVYTSLREVMLSPQPGSSIDSWIISAFTMVFFWVMHIDVLQTYHSRYRRRDLWSLGFFWALIAALTQGALFHFVYNVSRETITYSYSFLKMEPWPYMLVGLLIAPRFCAIYVRRWTL